MGNIDPMYQFALDAYIFLFSKSIDKSPKSAILSERINALNEFHTFAVYKLVLASVESTYTENLDLQEYLPSLVRKTQTAVLISHVHQDFECSRQDCACRVQFLTERWRRVGQGKSNGKSVCRLG